MRSFKCSLLVTIAFMAVAVAAQAAEGGPTAGPPQPEVLQLIARNIEAECQAAEKECLRIRESYQRLFLSGFISPGDSYGADWYARAYDAGHQYRRTHQAAFGQIMAALGFPLVAAIEGRWIVATEVSAFTPAR